MRKSRSSLSIKGTTQNAFGAPGLFWTIFSLRDRDVRSQPRDWQSSRAIAAAEERERGRGRKEEREKKGKRKGACPFLPRCSSADETRTAGCVVAFKAKSHSLLLMTRSREKERPRVR